MLVFEKYGEVGRSICGEEVAVEKRLCDCSCGNMMMEVGVLHTARGGDDDEVGGGEGVYDDADVGGVARCGIVVEH